jgi:hypothetical protein
MTTPERLRTAAVAAAKQVNETAELGEYGCLIGGQWIKTGDAIAARREEFARTIALEAGKPIRTARLEVDRAIFTFKVAAEESRRIYGEIVPLDWIPGTEGREAQIRRVRDPQTHQEEKGSDPKNYC